MEFFADIIYCVLTCVFETIIAIYTNTDTTSGKYTMSEFSSLLEVSRSTLVENGEGNDDIDVLLDNESEVAAAWFIAAADSQPVPGNGTTLGEFPSSVFEDPILAAGLAAAVEVELALRAGEPSDAILDETESQNLSLSASEEMVAYILAGLSLSVLAADVTTANAPISDALTEPFETACEAPVFPADNDETFVSKEPVVFAVASETATEEDIARVLASFSLACISSSLESTVVAGDCNDHCEPMSVDSHVPSGHFSRFFGRRSLLCVGRIPRVPSCRVARRISCVRAVVRSCGSRKPLFRCRRARLAIRQKIARVGGCRVSAHVAGKAEPVAAHIRRTRGGRVNKLRYAAFVRQCKAGSTRGGGLVQSMDCTW